MRILLRHRFAVRGEVRAAETRRTSDKLSSRVSRAARHTGTGQLCGSVLCYGSYVEKRGWVVEREGGRGAGGDLRPYLGIALLSEGLVMFG